MYFQGCRLSARACASKYRMLPLLSHVSSTFAQVCCRKSCTWKHSSWAQDMMQLGVSKPGTSWNATGARQSSDNYSTIEKHIALYTCTQQVVFIPNAPIQCRLEHGKNHHFIQCPSSALDRGIGKTLLSVLPLWRVALGYCQTHHFLRYPSPRLERTCLFTIFQSNLGGQPRVHVSQNPYPFTFICVCFRFPWDAMHVRWQSCILTSIWETDPMAKNYDFLNAPVRGWIGVS